MARLRSALCFAGCLLTAFAVSSLPRLARGADYTDKKVGDYLEMDVDTGAPHTWKAVTSSNQYRTVKNMLRGDDPMDAPTFDTFFKKEYFPQFTFIKDNVFIESADPKENHTSRLPKMRMELSKLIDQAKGDQNKVAFDFLNKLTLDAMTRIALNNYHPLARYNAALTLGEMKEQGQTPYADALPVLVRCLSVQGAELVRIAALSGLTNFVRGGAADKDKAALVAALVKLIDDRTSPAGDTPEGRTWIRRKAIELLAAMKEPGAGGSGIAAMVAVLKDNQSPLPLCCAASRGLGNYDLKALGATELAALTASIGQCGIDVVRAELARAADLAAAAPLPIPGLGRPGVAAGGVGVGAAPAASPLYIAAAELKSRLQSLEYGLKGAAGRGVIAATKGGQLETAVAGVDKALTTLIAACDATYPTYSALRGKLEQGASVLETAVGRVGGKGRAPAVGGADDAFGDAAPDQPAKPKDKPAPTPDKAAPPKTVLPKAAAGA